MTAPPADLTCTVVASALHNPAEVAELIAPVRAQLEAHGAAFAASPQKATPHAYVLATGGTESSTLNLIEQRRESQPGEPVLLFAHRAHNSVPAALEALARVHQDGGRGRIVLCGEPDDVDHLAEAIRDLDVWHRFQRCQIGLIGEPSPWLVASTPPAEAVAATWGASLTTVDMSAVLATAAETPVAVGASIARRFDAGDNAGHPLPPPGDLAAAAHLHPVLDTVHRQHDLDAISVRCFDFLGELETSGCIALAQFNDDGFVAGCEGDVASTIAMLWVRYLLDQPSWIANPASIDAATNTLELAHCTVAPSMVSNVSLSTHFESGIGVGIHGHFAPGPVTLLRLGGRRLDRSWIAEGSIVDSPTSLDRCRTQAVVEVLDREVNELLEAPLGNHVVMVAGHHRDRLERWWRFAIEGGNP